MKTDFTDDELSEQIHINEDEARRLLTDKDKTEDFLKRLESKLSKIPKVGKALSDILMLVFAMKLVGDDVDEYRGWLKTRERVPVK